MLLKYGVFYCLSRSGPAQSWRLVAIEEFVARIALELVIDLDL